MTGRLPFTKMQGCGNDFVVIDARAADVAADVSAFLDDAAAVARLCDRRLGIGCDQLVAVIEGDGSADARMMIRNADGSAAGMCGNAARCVAHLLMGEKRRKSLILAIDRRVASCRREKNGQVQVDMGPPASIWETAVLDGLPMAVCVDMGNPHAVFIVPDADAIDLETLGPQIERHALFAPARTNVEFVSRMDAGALRLRVWERGAGVTPACGSGACAGLMAARYKGVAGDVAAVRMDGGTLRIERRASDTNLLMTGPATTVFKGIYALE